MMEVTERPDPDFDSVEIGTAATDSTEAALQAETSFTNAPQVGIARAPQIFTSEANEVTFNSSWGHKFLSTKYVLTGFMILVTVIVVITTTSGVFSSTSDEITTSACTTQVCRDAVTEIVESLNSSVNPCDNFYEFACQGWQKSNPRPEYRPKWNVFSKLENLTNTIVADILKEPHPENTPIAKAQQFFHKCMERGDMKNDTSSTKQDNETFQFIWNTLESYGGWPILYNGTWNASSRFSLEKSLAALQEKFAFPVFLDISSLQSADDNNKTGNVVLLRRPSIALGLTRAMPSHSTKTPFETVVIVSISKILLRHKGKEFDDNYLEQRAEEIFDMNNKLREIGLIHEIDAGFMKKHDFDENHAIKSLEKLEIALKDYVPSRKMSLNLSTWLNCSYNNTGIEIQRNESISVSDVNYLLALFKYLSTIDTEIIANYIHFQMLSEMIALTTDVRLRKPWREFLKSVYGIEKEVPRQEFCVDLVQRKFTNALAAPYIERRGFNNSVKVGIMFRRLKSTFTGLINNSTLAYLNTSKTDLLEILDSFKLCMGFSARNIQKDHVNKEYADLILNESTLLEQVLAVNTWSYRKNLKTLRDPADKERKDKCDWSIFPGQIRVFISESFIYLPLGVLQAPYFHADLPRPILYGRLGAILGHEMSHGLAQKAWSKSENDTLPQEAKCLERQYSSFNLTELKPHNMRVNGTLTLDENIADNAGLMGAYKAYKAYSTNNAVVGNFEKLKNYTDDQLFFLGYAQNWCESITVEAQRENAKRDEHVPPKYRVLGSLQNSKEFAEAWGCKSGLKMNPDSNEHKKCVLF